MSGELPEARLSLKEACRLTSLSRATLYRAINSGHLLARKLYNKRTVIAASDLAAFIKNTETPMVPLVQGGDPAAYCVTAAARAEAPKSRKRLLRRKAA